MLSRQAFIAPVLLLALTASCCSSPGRPDTLEAGFGDATDSAVDDAHGGTAEGGDESVDSTESDGELATDGVADTKEPYDDAGERDAPPLADAGEDARPDAVLDGGVQCGPRRCDPGLDCCDPSCSLCALGSVCAEIGVCAPSADAQPPNTCGAQTCSQGQVCVYSLLGGTPAQCTPLNDAGFCGSESSYTPTCPNLGDRPGCMGPSPSPQPLSCIDIPASCGTSPKCDCFPPGVCADAGAGAATCALVDSRSLTCATE